MILSWAKPAKVMTTGEWKSIQADSAPDGVYTPNMSAEDKQKWKARKIGGSDPRVEIRKTVSSQGDYAQVLIVIRPGTVTMSMNGKAVMTALEAGELIVALLEGKAALADGHEDDGA